MAEEVGGVVVVVGVVIVIIVIVVEVSVAIIITVYLLFIFNRIKSIFPSTSPFKHSRFPLHSTICKEYSPQRC